MPLQLYKGHRIPETIMCTINGLNSTHEIVHIMMEVECSIIV